MAAALFYCTTLGGGLEARGDIDDYRSMFIDRFDYTFNGADVATMEAALTAQINRAADDGFTEVVFQVRARGDAFYEGNVEPRAANLTAGFDPLQTAIEASHARGLKLHAWFNSTPMWNTAALTPPAGHIFNNTSPSFRLQDINGNLEPQQGWVSYSVANPILPEMHAHLNNVITDVATNYAVDGIHLDYIRYLPGTFNTTNFARMPHDPISHDMFRAATDPDGPGGPQQGLDGADVANFAQYKTFLTNRITDLVASVKQTVDSLEVSENRAMELTASVFMSPTRAKNEYGQDWGRWIDEGLLDVAMPMLYLAANNDHLFDPYLADALRYQHPGSPTRVAPTLGSYLHVAPNGGGVELTIDQMRRAEEMGAQGIGFYDYPAFYNAYTEEDREAIREVLDPTPGAPGNVLDGFEVNEGRFSWNHNQSSDPHTYGLASSTTITRTTAEAQWGDASQLINIVASDGDWQLRHNSGFGVPGSPVGNAPLAATGSVGFWLKTDEENVYVHLAVDDGFTAELGVDREVIADGKWHLYQWNLENAADWEDFLGGDGAINSETVSIDAIYLFGSDDAQIYLDTVSHNPEGKLAAPFVMGDFDGDGSASADDLAAWTANFGMTSKAEVGEGDADADGDVDGNDFLAWQRNVGGPAAMATPVPEPSAALLAALAGLYFYSRRSSPS